MGLACYNLDRDKIKGKTKYDDTIENPRRSSRKSKSYNTGYIFSPIDGNDNDGRTDSKKDNVKIQKEQNNGSKSNSKTNKNQNTNEINRNNNRKKTDNKSNKKNTKSNKNNGHNDDGNNNKDNDDAAANINDKNNENTNDFVIIKSYLDFNINSEYYISCPNCKKKVPMIINADYDSYKDDFIVEYLCNCISNEDDKKSYFINFISDKEPENITFSFESIDKLKSMLDIVRDKQDDFQGFLILDKIYKNLIKLRKTKSYNKSMAPPANFQKSLVDNKNN